MIRNTTKRQKLGWVLFILYLCFLAYFMFFSESFGRTDTDRGYQYNLVPFKEITRYFRYYDVLGPTLFMINMIGNVAAFMPFGFFLPIISRRSKKWYNTVMFGFVFSLMLETLQLVFKVGSFDVDDMLLNTWVGDKVSYVRNPFARNSYYCLTLAVLGLALGTASMYLSVARAGQGGLNTGAYGFSSLVAALMGLWYGVRSFMEKDRNYILAKIGISICVVLVIVWAVIIITGIVR